MNDKKNLLNSWLHNSSISVEKKFNRIDAVATDDKPKRTFENLPASISELVKLTQMPVKRRVKGGADRKPTNDRLVGVFTFQMALGEEDVSNENLILILDKIKHEGGVFYRNNALRAAQSLARKEKSK
jgi:hypothetical protein